MSSQPQSRTVALRIPRTHPALAGHFPGRPIVPGVVLVDYAIRAAEEWLGRSLHIRTITQIKFNTPLEPEQECLLDLTVDAADDRLRFTIRRDDDVIVQGIVGQLSAQHV